MAIRCCSGIKPLTHGRVITISRRAKVTKDDRIQSYGALILGGNGKGVGGYGYGRGKSAQLALIDAEKKLHLNLQTLPLYEDYTIFHSVVGYFKRTVAIIRPAADGRGLQAGKLGHGIMACFGIKNAYCKVRRVVWVTLNLCVLFTVVLFCIDSRQLYGQNNIYSQTKSIFKALSLVRSAEELAMARGRKIWELNRSWIDRPARFLAFTTPERVRMKDEARLHEERVREVRKILVDGGRDQLEELLSSPAGLKAYVDSLTVERQLNGDPTPWLKSAAEDLGPGLDVDFNTAAVDPQEEEMADDEVLYADKDLVAPSSA